MKPFPLKKRLWVVLTGSALVYQSLRRSARWKAWRFQLAHALRSPRIHYRIVLLLAVTLAMLLWWSVLLFARLPIAALAFGGRVL
jgi:hypothetical protein